MTVKTMGVRLAVWLILLLPGLVANSALTSDALASARIAGASARSRAQTSGPPRWATPGTPAPVRVVRLDGQTDPSPMVFSDEGALPLVGPAPAPHSWASLIALSQQHSEESPESRPRYRVYQTNLVWDAEGQYSPIGRCSQSGPELLLQRRYPLVLFDLLVAVEWDATPEYLEELKQGWKKASDYLFDLTDGQMAFGNITIFDHSLKADHKLDGRTADYVIKADNTICPAHWPPDTVEQEHVVSIGPYWTRYGTLPGQWNNDDGFRTLVHEFGHYALGLYDEYLVETNEKKLAEDAYCTEPKGVLNDLAAKRNASHLASAMSWQYSTTELSARPPACPGRACPADWPLWSDACFRTLQWQRRHASAWDWIQQSFADPQAPVCGSSSTARWEIVSPTERGTVMPGPDALPKGLPWPAIKIQSYTAEGCSDQPGECVSPRKQCFEGFKCSDAAIDLTKNLAKDMETFTLGTLDSDGCITILGAEEKLDLVLTFTSKKCEIDQSCRLNGQNGNVLQKIEAEESSLKCDRGFQGDVSVAAVEPGEPTTLMAGVPAVGAVDAFAANLEKSVQGCPELFPGLDALSPVESDPFRPLGQATAWWPPNEVSNPLAVPDPFPWANGSWTSTIDVDQNIQQFPPDIENGVLDLVRNLPQLIGSNQTPGLQYIDEMLSKLRVDYECRPIDTTNGSILTADEGLVQAFVPPQVPGSEVFVGSWETPPGTVPAEYVSLGATVEIRSSQPLSAPIALAFSAGCGPYDAAKPAPLDKAALLGPQGTKIPATFLPDRQLLVAAIAEPGTYQWVLAP